MSSIDVSLLIDDRNREIWDNLNEQLEIDVQESTDNEYHVYSEGKKSTIYVVADEMCIDSFMHKLLHVYIRYKEIFIAAGFSNTISASNTLNNIISPALKEHFGNCLDHIKMYQIYEKLGFTPKKFITDFDLHKCNPAELSSLKKYYKERGAYNVQAVDLYIGKFIAIFADFNNDLDYEPALNILYKLDPELYTALDCFIEKWEEFDIENQDPISNSYYVLLFELYDDLKKWMNGKRFISSK